MISGPNQHANNHSPAEQPCIPMVRTVATDNGPFVTPMDHMLRNGVHSNSHWELGGSSNEHHSTYISMEAQHLPPPFSRPPVDPYSHSSTNGNISLAPVGPVGHIHYNHHNIPSVGGVTAGNGGPYKRKIPSISEGSSSSFYGAGSSSSPQMFTEKPAVDRYDLPPYRGSNLSIDDQDLMRNVRSRSRSELEPCAPRNYAPSYASHYYQPITQSANYSFPVQPVNQSADVASREWNSVSYAASSHGRAPPPDINWPRREASQFYAGGSSVDIDTCHRDQFFRRNHVSSSQDPHVPHAQFTRDTHNYHSQRVTPLYINGPRYYNYTNGGSSSTNEQQLPPDDFSSRYSRHSPTRGWGRRPRIGVEGLQPIIDVMDSYDGLGHESPFYQNSRNLLDQYQDMRLDIDNMSYEELLALEESIGDVNTGLSEHGMSKCLREHVYYSVDQKHEEANCPICLEEYKNGEKVGKMERCGHEYHVECIKKWLLMKKVCPICKSEC